MNWASRLALVLFLAGLGGCRTWVIPPAQVADPVTVYVPNYGKHTSVLLPNGEGLYREYAYGDWDYFALERRGTLDALRAALASRGAALGTRVIAIDPQRPVARQLGAVRVLALAVSRDRAELLRTALEMEHAQWPTAQVYSPLNQLTFVPSDEPYWLGNNCNHLTARWLRDLGCRVRGSAMTSDFYLKTRN